MSKDEAVSEIENIEANLMLAKQMLDQGELTQAFNELVEAQEAIPGAIDTVDKMGE